MSNLALRFLSAFLLLPLIFLVGYFGGWALWSLILVFGGFALWELGNLFHFEKSDFFPVFMIFLLFLLSLRPEICLSLEIVLALSLLIGAIFTLFKGGNNRSIKAAQITFSPIYLGFLLRFIYLLREGPKGFYLLTIFLLSTFASDSVAFFVGKYLGKRKVFPRISPGKTLEGTLSSPLGGIIGAVAAALIFGEPLLPVIPLGVIVSLFSLIGDLFESIFKREAQKKDSSLLIPGHGGFLDRLDSLLFTAPLVYFYSVVFLI
ncbi:MAG: phosphatidate cytidylyltransferase [Caldiserica bacterium]|jgi:phosphatidate cytidylyltransferase|nr:phosphatidate cytidylyltransferase [Caldisericota bacterium]MDH7562883.1 phosphatidate cytidylyltransferase [Caldisericota bacterium]